MANVPVSVVIPTYKRGHLLGYVFDALSKQIYKDFEVLVILKPSGDGTEAVIQKYKKALKIQLIVQSEGYITDALNLGLANSNGKIILLLDDDAVPVPSWVQSHVETYKTPNVGGVAGNVLSAKLKGEKIVPNEGQMSQIIPYHKIFLKSFALKIWSRPIEGLEDYLVYISKAGVVEYNYDVGLLASRQLTKSLLGMGANMSFLSDAVKDFKFPDSWILGLSFEQFLGWHIWRKGYNLIFNHDAQVYHLEHGQTLSRNIRNPRRERLRWIERDLLFYRLYGIEENLSRMHRISWLIFSTADNIKKICRNRETDRIVRMKASFNSGLIGLKWLLSRKLRGYYSPLTDMRKYLK
jgi:glycosyltransferase involved in cell wall biosynthesis